MAKDYFLSPHQTGGLYQPEGASTAYRTIELIDPETGDKVTVRVETMPWRVDTAFAYVREKLGV